MTDPQTRARELLRDVPLVDGHNDLPWAVRLLAGYDLEKADVGGHHPATRTDLPRLRAGGVGAQFWSVYVPSDLPGGAAVTATLEQIDFVHRLVQTYPQDLGLAVSADEVQAVFGSGRVASLLGAEGGHSIDCSLAALRGLHALGVRYMTLTHNDNVPWADSATDEPRSNGLSAFGREVVSEMNRLGMLVDLSHVSADTMRQALDVTEAPVIFSHSSCRGLVDNPRNVPDDVLVRLRDGGGVCMVTFVPYFVSQECSDWWAAAKAQLSADGIDLTDQVAAGPALEEFAAASPRPVATVSQVADHVEHARELAGVDAIGIGGDYDGCDVMPTGLEDVAGYPLLFAELIDRGWSDDDLSALAGRNVLRALREAELVAGRVQKQRAPSVATIELLDGPGAGPAQPVASTSAATVGSP